MPNERPSPHVDADLEQLAAWQRQRDRDPTPDPLDDLAVTDVPVLDHAHVDAMVDSVVGGPRASGVTRLLRAVASPLGTGLVAAAVAVAIVQFTSDDKPAAYGGPLAETNYEAHLQANALGPEDRLEFFTYDRLDVTLEPNPPLDEETGALELRIGAQSVALGHTVLSAPRAVRHRYGEVRFEERISTLFDLPPGEWDITYLLGPPGSCSEWPMALSCKPRGTDRVVIKPERDT
ncbi:MAG: hypothetical protein AAF799_16775 [Myxococcota bacterium]